MCIRDSYAHEAKKWREWKEQEETLLRRLHVDETIIQQLREYDWKMFKMCIRDRTNFDNALNKLSGGDMFSNVMMITSDITLLSPIYEDYAFKSMVNIPVTFQSIKNGDKRYQLIIPNRGPQFFADARFTNRCV